jgi:uncharacterized protein YdeI (YjbR/CyaY-like superfamily)
VSAPRTGQAGKTAAARPSATAPMFFASAPGFRAWLAKNADDASFLNVGFYKVGSGRSSLTWPQSVAEALCYGSVWSAINIARAKELIAEGRMRQQGLRAFEQRIERKSKLYSYEQHRAAQLTEPELRRFRRNKAAWAWFERLAPSRRRAMLHWIASAKRPDTRARRLDKLIESSASGVGLMP